METGKSIVIVGASARAAAMSALRGALLPIAADLFADMDLQVLCRSERIDDYPDGLIELLPKLPAGPWMYTGGLENHPSLLARLERQRPLLGNSSDVVAAVRDPLRLADALRDYGLPAADVSLQRPPHSPRRWLDKPICSSGGIGVRFAEGDSPTRAAREFDRRADRYYQAFIKGQPASALYIATEDGVKLIGVTHQLIGEDWTGCSTGFGYCGSVGPVDVRCQQQDQLQRLGKCLTDTFELRGVFGVDIILRDESLWPIEVNPRYTASAELYDWALDASIVRCHYDACLRQRLPNTSFVAGPGHFGKAVVYATQSCILSQTQCLELQSWNQGLGWPIVADIPAPDSKFDAGDPLVTVCAAERTVQGVKQSLRELANEVRHPLDVS